MKLIDIVNARNSLQKLIQQDIPLRQAYELVKLTDKINVHLDFYGQERVKRWGNEEKLIELDSFPVDDLPEDRMQIAMTDTVLLSAVDVKALEPFIEFV